MTLGKNYTIKRKTHRFGLFNKKFYVMDKQLNGLLIKFSYFQPGAINFYHHRKSTIALIHIIHGRHGIGAQYMVKYWYIDKD